MSLYTEVQVQEVDNRGSDVTWLWINNQEYIEVSPIGLLENMIENLDEDTRLLLEHIPALIKFVVNTKET